MFGWCVLDGSSCICRCRKGRSVIEQNILELVHSVQCSLRCLGILRSTAHSRSDANCHCSSSGSVGTLTEYDDVVDLSALEMIPQVVTFVGRNGKAVLMCKAGIVKLNFSRRKASLFLPEVHLQPNTRNVNCGARRGPVSRAS